MKCFRVLNTSSPRFIRHPLSFIIMQTITRDQVIAYLVKCPPGEFIRILSPALHAQAGQSDSKGQKLALCCFTPNDTPLNDESPWTDIDVVAAPPSDAGPSLESDCYGESGTCTHCRIGVVSYAKDVICPLCDSRVELT